MLIGIPSEICPGEARVAATPDSVRQLCGFGYAVKIQSGAGNASGFFDAAYAEAGAEVVDGARDAWSDADVILKVRPPVESSALGCHECELMKSGSLLVSFICLLYTSPSPRDA